MDGSILTDQDKRVLRMNQVEREQLECFLQDGELVSTQMTRILIVVLVSRRRPLDRQLSQRLTLCVTTLAPSPSATNPTGLSDTTCEEFQPQARTIDISRKPPSAEEAFGPALL